MAFYGTVASSRKRSDPEGRSVWDFTHNHEAAGSEVWLKTWVFVFVRTTVATLNPVAIAKKIPKKSVRASAINRKNGVRVTVVLVKFAKGQYGRTFLEQLHSDGKMKIMRTQLSFFIRLDLPIGCHHGYGGS